MDSRIVTAYWKKCWEALHPVHWVSSRVVDLIGLAAILGAGWKLGVPWAIAILGVVAAVLFFVGGYRLQREAIEATQFNVRVSNQPAHVVSDELSQLAFLVHNDGPDGEFEVFVPHGAIAGAGDGVSNPYGGFNLCWQLDNEKARRIPRGLEDRVLLANSLPTQSLIQFCAPMGYLNLTTPTDLVQGRLEIRDAKRDGRAVKRCKFTISSDGGSYSLRVFDDG